MGTKGTIRQPFVLQHRLQLPISPRVTESKENLESYIANRQATALGLHATSTGADESNTAKVGIGGDDGHDERENGE